MSLRVQTISAARASVPSHASKRSPKVRFRHGSSARFDTDFPEDQTWVPLSGRSMSHSLGHGALSPQLWLT